VKHDKQKTEIELKIPKKLVIHNYYYVSLDDFIDEVFSYPVPINVFWSNGILFIFSAMDITASERLTNDYMDGIMHWDYVTFCKQDKKITELKGNSVGMEVKIIDASNYHPHSEFAKFVKERILTPNVDQKQ